MVAQSGLTPLTDPEPLVWYIVPNNGQQVLALSVSSLVPKTFELYACCCICRSFSSLTSVVHPPRVPTIVPYPAHHRFPRCYRSFPKRSLRGGASLNRFGIDFFWPLGSRRLFFSYRCLILAYIRSKGSTTTNYLLTYRRPGYKSPGPSRAFCLVLLNPSCAIAWAAVSRPHSLVSS